MANGLLSAIANPRIANIVGAQQLGQQQAQQNQLFQQQQQQLAQQQRANELAGQILGQTVGGKLAAGGFEELPNGHGLARQQVRRLGYAHPLRWGDRSFQRDV